MTEKDTVSERDHGPDRWTLIRDVAVFQVKVLCDGLRDLLLVPVSLAAGLISLLGGSAGKPGTEFYDLLKLGRRSERWINLFGAASSLHGPPTEEERFVAEDIDQMVSRVESFIVHEYNKGGVTAQAKKRLDTALDAIQKRAHARDEEA